MLNNSTITSFLILLVVALTACSGNGGTSEGDANLADGEALFAETIIGVQPGCATCHSLEPDMVIVGPSMAGVATRAEGRVSGKSAEDYLRESILHPDAYVVDGFDPGIMVQVWEEELTAQQVDELVTYLLTLK